MNTQVRLEIIADAKNRLSEIAAATKRCGEGKMVVLTENGILTTLQNGWDMECQYMAFGRNMTKSKVSAYLEEEEVFVTSYDRERWG